MCVCVCVCVCVFESQRQGKLSSEFHFLSFFFFVLHKWQYNKSGKIYFLNAFSNLYFLLDLLVMWIVTCKRCCCTLPMCLCYHTRKFIMQTYWIENSLVNFPSKHSSTAHNTVYISIIISLHVVRWQCIICTGVGEKKHIFSHMDTIKSTMS